MSGCVFCKIVKKEIPAYKIYEDAEILAFLDAFPAVRGQVLVIPKKHIAPYLFDTDENIYKKLMSTAKKIVKGIDNAMKPVKTGMLVEGLELDHIHIKLFPLSKEGFKCLCNPIKKPGDAEMQDIANKIRENL